VPICEDCGAVLACKECLYCGVGYEEINENAVKNISSALYCKKEEHTVECVILMIDLSGSMNCTYPSRYKKINKDFVARALGTKNFEVLKSAIGEN
jgi:hypothetical protein